MDSRLTDFLDAHRRIFVLTGAGVSTASGIPDYRNERGEWKHRKPMDYRDFVERPAARRRYWSRSYAGWQRFRQARPNPAHASLARLEGLGRVQRIVTQNVDGLHQRAGSRDVTELHGSLATVACLGCGAAITRAEMQQRLLELNPEFGGLTAAAAPDGDARLLDFDEAGVEVPVCDSCGGILKPEVVFFGEAVPLAKVEESYTALELADAVLVVGSSLMVYSGFRFVRRAVQAGLPTVAINRGQTRADEMLTFKLEQDCVAALADAVARL